MKEDNKKQKIFISIVSTLLVTLLVVGSSYAFWFWISNENINVSFNIASGFSCSVDGGGDISTGDIELQPTNCKDSTHAIVREININVSNSTYDEIVYELWLNINAITESLSRINNFMWALTDSPNGCDSGNVIGEGNFLGIKSGDRVILSNGRIDNRTYYLYIWLDEAETNIATTDQEFNFTLGGECTNELNIVSRPVIVNGLIPVKLSTSGDTVTTVAKNDPTWYNYNNKLWANAVLVTDRSRGNYEGTSNVPVTQSDILAYFVWIPRYSYKVWRYTTDSLNSREQEIDIKFVPKTTKESASGNNYWQTHPAFTFGTTELSGIWVGKFETSHETLTNASNSLGADSGTLCIPSQCDYYKGLRILPNVSSLRYNRIANYFNATRLMEDGYNPFGLNANTVDSHMMKNSEWGAVAYLSHSRYGKNGEISRNESSSYITGCGSGTCNDTTGGYTHVTSYPQSTTGNVTGVFDMSGGAYEYVMGHWGSTTVYGTNSGFSDKYPLPPAKYYNNYAARQFPNTNASSNSNIDLCDFSACGGHALHETKGWYSDNYNKFVVSSSPFFSRGGYYGNNDGAGAFAIFSTNGGPSTYASFRIVLVNE